MQDEVWKDIPGYEGLYQVSNFGNVKSLSRIKKGKNKNGIFTYLLKDKLLKSYLDDKNYYLVKLYKDSKKTNFKVHKLVAMSFLNHRPCGYELVIDHINNISTDNRLENLQIVTSRYNCSKDRKGSSKYTGVSWDKKRRKWESYISYNKKRKFLGYFNNEDDAGNAYLKKLKEIQNEKKQS